MNVITKNEKGKIHHIVTYIGIEGNGFVCVGNAENLDAPGSMFSYASFVKQQGQMRKVLVEIFESNTGVR